jgi:DNA helicase-2/ATP-dependent DNA helicase PcrA
MPNWSEQQEAIFNWFQSGAGNLVVVARAGTGKTTTVLEGANRAPEKAILFCAFNKKIADELAKKLSNRNAEAKTLHALGFSCLRARSKSLRVDAQRGYKIARDVCGDKCPDDIVALVAKLASRAKGMAPFAAKHGDLTDIAYAHDCVPDEEWEDDGYDLAYVEGHALKALEVATERDGTVDFDDMVYLPVRCRLVRACYDLVIVDEAQDMNAAQLVLALGACRKTGRIAVIGDDRQAIYGFRGADSGSIDRLKTELQATTLKLTTTYRCPKTVVAEAAKLVPDYEAALSAPDGVITSLGQTKLPETALEGDFILSRTNAPLVSCCLKCLRLGKRAKIEGKDIGAGLLSLVKKLATGPNRESISNLLEKLTQWAEREVARARKSADHNAETRIAAIEDRAETIRALAEGLANISELKTRLDELFEDSNGNAPRIVCSTIHKAKGLEAGRVFILTDTFRKDATSIEEANIRYVAITRAQRELVWVA